MHPACFVMQCTLMGKWYELVDGRTTKVEKGKVYEGIGINTRAAKFKAASAALGKLQGMLPGLQYEEGVVPKIHVKISYMAFQ